MNEHTKQDRKKDDGKDSRTTGQKQAIGQKGKNEPAEDFEPTTDERTNADQTNTTGTRRNQTTTGGAAEQGSQKPAKVKEKEKKK